jgi:hypothetical protein
MLHLLHAAFAAHRGRSSAKEAYRLRRAVVLGLAHQRKHARRLHNVA